MSRFVAYIWPSARASSSAGVDAVLREERPADRRVELDEAAVDAVRAAERLPDPAGERRRLLVLGRPEREDDELVAADAGDRVGLAHDRLEPAGDRPQHRVPDLVAADVVDALEAVEVDDEQRERLVRAPRAGERLGDTVVEQVAVRAAR